ncbi:hypothetical protein [Aquimarina sediminis]|uniref:hypothetical protein n=1 Tax=Aquimarina sediminis TaxID=2070536 RepID=UPI000FFF07CE|nr:hypothetical protein [Aquimarina sediminis]
MIRIRLPMNKLFYYIICITLISSCSEGDIIDNDISNFTAELEKCSNQEENTFVFFKTDTQINQSLSLGFTSTTFELDTAPEDLITTITLNENTNTLIYRQFESKINGAEYFCSSVPPSGINVTQELKSSDGNAEIKYVIKNEDATSITYTRTITLINITLIGPDISIRQESLEFGQDEITVLK